MRYRIEVLSCDQVSDIKEYTKSAYKTAAWIGTLGALIMSVLIWLIQTLVLSHSNDSNKVKQPDIHITIDSSILKNSQPSTH